MQGLKHLFLNSNRIEDEGATHIAQMTGIGCLELKSNQIAAVASSEHCTYAQRYLLKSCEQSNR